MAKKTAEEKPEVFEMKGELMFTDNDALVARFDMKDRTGTLISNRRVQFPADILPPDFDRMAYDVEGSYAFKVIVTKK